MIIGGGDTGADLTDCGTIARGENRASSVPGIVTAGDAVDRFLTGGTGLPAPVGTDETPITV